MSLSEFSKVVFGSYFKYPFENVYKWLKKSSSAESVHIFDSFFN
jgi:hypothetical protein